MSEHTRGPWRVGKGLDDGLILDATGAMITTDCETAEIARRIVACVNACAGISTEELERRQEEHGHQECDGGFIAAELAELDSAKQSAELAYAARDDRARRVTEVIEQTGIALRQMREQRDQLLAALEQIANETTRNLGSARIVARAAIASVEHPNG